MLFDYLDRGDRRYQQIGWLLALCWIIAAFPDLVATFFGYRATNDISVTPVWLKALRDIATLFVALYFTRHLNRKNLIWRIAAVMVFVAYVIYGIGHGFALAIALRGSLWMLALVWCMTADAGGCRRLYAVALGVFNIVLPVAIGVSLILGLLGVGMYFESVGPYERNPGLFLTPSATAFMACLIFLLSPAGRVNGLKSGLMGVLTLSGIFFINAALLFGRLNRWIYLLSIAAIVVILMALGSEGIISVVSWMASFLRGSNAVSLTLGTRVLIILDTISKITVAGSYPIGLNIAANQEIEVFFPDNAYLSLAYAYGVVGMILSVLITAASLRAKNFGFFILVFIAGLFYVWFENLLFCVLVGLALNSHLHGIMRDFSAKKI
ncbi:hypothetical protein [Duganella sp. FT27W]|uniref:hypothetical protein n=1 Tax=Duganella sp. FT27W TaxID=2654636 RepID=UPI00128B9D04|nr:hypothetical protein [Duganella sp. FT27W]MPQ57137.1 hypothetical protein [Duganella sp. FT27W]